MKHTMAGYCMDRYGSPMGFTSLEMGLTDNDNEHLLILTSCHILTNLSPVSTHIIPGSMISSSSPSSSQITSGRHGFGKNSDGCVRCLR